MKAKFTISDNVWEHKNRCGFLRIALPDKQVHIDFSDDRKGATVMPGDHIRIILCRGRIARPRHKYRSDTKQETSHICFVLTVGL